MSGLGNASFHVVIASDYYIHDRPLPARSARGYSIFPYHTSARSASACFRRSLSRSRRGYESVSFTGSPFRCASQVSTFRMGTKTATLSFEFRGKTFLCSQALFNCFCLSSMSYLSPSTTATRTPPRFRTASSCAGKLSLTNRSPAPAPDFSTACILRLRFLKNLLIEDACCLSSQRTVIFWRFMAQAPARRAPKFSASFRSLPQGCVYGFLVHVPTRPPCH